MQAQVFSKISDFMYVHGSVRSLIAYAEFQFEGFHVHSRDDPFDQQIARASSGLTSPFEMKRLFAVSVNRQQATSQA